MTIFVGFISAILVFARFLFGPPFGSAGRNGIGNRGAAGDAAKEDMNLRQTGKGGGDATHGRLTSFRRGI